MKTSITIALLHVFFVVANAQQNIKLKIEHFLGSQPFAMQQAATNNLGHDFDVGRLQYYLSGFSVVHDGGQSTAVNGVYALVDASVSTIIDLGSLPVTSIEGIKFHVGVNTPENNQDPALWPASHPLSPKNPSMHWGWASGYFFIALGGQGGASLNQVYELHGLGNTNYFSQTVNAPAIAVGSDLVITIHADYVEALRNISVSGGIVSHGSTGAAATAIANFRDHVFSAPSQPVALEESGAEQLVLVYPNPVSNNCLSINLHSLPSSAESISVLDISGRIVFEKRLKEITGNSIALNGSGIYFVQVHASSGLLASQKVVAMSE